MPNYFNAHDYTLAELQGQLAQNEAEYELRKHEKNPVYFRDYLATRNLLETAIIDKQTGPAKRRVREAIEPFSNRIKKSEWVGFQTNLRSLRSEQAVYEFYRNWRAIL